MAITLANIEYNVMGGGPGGKWIYADITMDTAYAPGGQTVTAAQLGLTVIKACFISDCEDGFILDVNLNAAKSILTFKVWIGANATTSASIPVESNVRDLSAVTYGVLIRGV